MTTLQTILALSILACPCAVHAGNPADICTAFPAGFQVVNGKNARLQTVLTELPVRPPERETKSQDSSGMGSITGEAPGANSKPGETYQSCNANEPGNAHGRLRLEALRTASIKHALTVAETACYRDNVIQVLADPNHPYGPSVEVHANCAKVAGIGDFAFEGLSLLDNEKGTSSTNTDGRGLVFARGPYMASVSFSLSRKAAAYAVAQQIDRELASWKQGESLNTPQFAAAPPVVAAPVPQGAMMPPAQRGGNGGNGNTAVSPTRSAGNMPPPPPFRPWENYGQTPAPAQGQKNVTRPVSPPGSDNSAARANLGSAAPCFPNNQDAASMDPQSHFRFAQSQGAAALEANLLDKVRTVYGCKAMTSSGRSTFFADVSILIAKRFSDARCFDGDKDVISTDWNVHKNLWNGTNQWLDDLAWKVSAAFRCMSPQDRAAFFSEVSTTIASAPDRP